MHPLHDFTVLLYVPLPLHISYLARGMGEFCGADMQTIFPWPTCESHYNLVTQYSDFYSWVWYSLYDPHGPVHVYAGGVLDCRDTYKKIGEIIGNQSVAEELAIYAFIHRKNLYRSGYFKCEGSVDTSEKPDKVR